MAVFYHLLWIFAAGLLFFPAQRQVSTPVSSDQELIIFYQEGADEHFLSTTLPKIRQYAENKKIALQEIPAAKGLPAEITTTPAIVFQNAKGRSVFAARYAEFSSIENFIRTSRVFSQKKAQWCKENTLSWESGRTKVLAPLKITNLNGALPEGFSQAEFNRKAAEAIDQGMRQFQQEAKVCIGRTDRQFYLDAHPYVDAAGKMYLAIEIYSQFSCVDPVFSRMSEPLTGAFQEYEALFVKAGHIFEEQVLACIRRSTIGDAFSPVPEATPVLSWKELGLERTEEVAELSLETYSNFNIPGSWVFAGPLDAEIPVLQFQFMEPLDRYGGEVRQVGGRFQLDASSSLTEGAFEVDTRSLTMGMASLDEKVLKKYIKASQYRKALFTFQGLSGLPALELGKTTSTIVPGTFELMKIKKKVNMEANITPVLNPDQKPILLVQAQFSLRITSDFGIEGPDGPQPAKETMLFSANFIMQPSSSGTTASVK